MGFRCLGFIQTAKSPFKLLVLTAIRDVSTCPPDRRHDHSQGQGASMPFAPPFLIYTHVTVNN